MDKQLSIPHSTAVSLIPADDIWRMAESVAACGMYGMKTPDQAFALMMLCQADGLHPMKAVVRFHIIQGRPAMKAETMLAEFQRRGGHVKWIERSHQAAEAEFSSEGCDPVRVRWDMDDAKRAGLVGKDNWRQYPRAMLHARCVSEGVRAVLPECVVGIYTPEEAEALPPTDAGIEDLEAAREDLCRANAGTVQPVRETPANSFELLLAAPGVERVEGVVREVEERVVTERDEQRTVYDITFARDDGTTVLVGSRKLSDAEQAKSLWDDGERIVAAIKKQAGGGWKLFGLQRVEQFEEVPA